MLLVGLLEKVRVVLQQPCEAPRRAIIHLPLHEAVPYGCDEQLQCRQPLLTVDDLSGLEAAKDAALLLEHDGAEEVWRLVAAPGPIKRD